MNTSPNLNFRADVVQPTLEVTGRVIVGTALGSSSVTLPEARQALEELTEAIEEASAERSSDDLTEEISEISESGESAGRKADSKPKRKRPPKKS